MVNILSKVVLFLIERWVEDNTESGWWDYARSLRDELDSQISFEESK